MAVSKPIIRSSDMSEEMQQDAIVTAQQVRGQRNRSIWPGQTFAGVYVTLLVAGRFIYVAIRAWTNSRSRRMWLLTSRKSSIPSTPPPGTASWAGTLVRRSMRQCSGATLDRISPCTGYKTSHEHACRVLCNPRDQALCLLLSRACGCAALQKRLIPRRCP